ncbi:MAG: tyrosine-type recombinase/integrase [Gammaproteobacteria bacterium]|nr:tyrosine-type recombinase/integrase [Gammaproteobacteria bacterium]
MADKIIAPPKGLTDAFIKHLKPQGKQYEVPDKACAGLCIRVGNSGKKSFTWYYQEPETNKRRMMTFGRYGDGDDQLTLSAARKALDTAKLKLSAGELHSVKINTPKTVSELCDVFYTDRIIPHRRSPEAVKQVIEHDIKPVIGNKNISTLSTVAVVNCVQVVVKRGAVTHAGKVTAILKQLFKFAEGRGYIERSPAYALDKKDLGVVTSKRERWLEANEIKPVWDAISNAPKMSLPVKNGLKVLLLTGVRTGELLKAEWQYIDLSKKEWFIPKENTKTNTEWTVPLTNEVINLISQLQGIDPDYVFCGKNGMLSDKVTGRAMSRLFESGALTIEKVTPHDFRRTVRTHLEKLNVAPHIAEKCLNHSLGAINAAYNKNSYLDERREALERWSEFVNLHINPQSNVTYIRQAS